MLVERKLVLKLKVQIPVSKVLENIVMEFVNFAILYIIVKLAMNIKSVQLAIQDLMFKLMKLNFYYQLCGNV